METKRIHVKALKSGHVVVGCYANAKAMDYTPWKRHRVSQLANGTIIFTTPSGFQIQFLLLYPNADFVIEVYATENTAEVPLVKQASSEKIDEIVNNYAAWQKHADDRPPLGEDKHFYDSSRTALMSKAWSDKLRELQKASADKEKEKADRQILVDLYFDD